MLFNDIDLAGVDWSNVSSYSNEFNGNGFTISNLTDTQGLFGSLNGATVKNVTLENFNITSTTNVGTLAGTVSGNSTIDNVHVSGGSISHTGGNSTYAGGLVGHITIEYNAPSTIKVLNSTSSADVSSSFSAGGLVGIVSMAISTAGEILIDNCSVSGAVSTHTTPNSSYA
ncbi:hypothetical protein IKA92_00660, partial [bacterium]|nr:hypothetical protein [bacterium]